AMRESLIVCSSTPQGEADGVLLNSYPEPAYSNSNKRDNTTQHLNNGGILMKMAEVKNVAKKLHIMPGKMKKMDLIRTIQNTEGNEPCFLSGRNVCEQYVCSWRDDCKVS
ncbi:MAG: hypothetical protein KAI75_10125, partial [Desulfobulbaceae bacterium]|nr:hypothetical protein [Desulfobulbaceae bacterium]